MTILYLFRVFNMVFMGEAGELQAREGSPVMVGCVALLGFLSLASGIAIPMSSNFAHMAARQMLGIIQ